MATTVLETFGVIRADGTLELEQKLAVLPGRVKVRVESTEGVADLAKRFATLVATWREETRFSSKMRRAAEHPAYREIVAMGDQAVPLLLAELEKNGGHWFIALGEITGADPIPEESCGKVREMAAAWLAWGHANGYRWEHVFAS